MVFVDISLRQNGLRRVQEWSSSRLYSPKWPSSSPKMVFIEVRMVFVEIIFVDMIFVEIIFVEGSSSKLSSSKVSSSKWIFVEKSSTKFSSSMLSSWTRSSSIRSSSSPRMGFVESKNGLRREYLCQNGLHRVQEWSSSTFLFAEMAFVESMNCLPRDYIC